MFHIGQNSIYLRIQETRQDSHKTVCLCVCAYEFQMKDIWYVPIYKYVYRYVHIEDNSRISSNYCNEQMLWIIEIRRNENHIERDECPYRYIILHKSH